MKRIEWGYLIVSYLFLGGLSAGLYCVSALAALLHANGHDSAYKRIARLGALLAPWPVLIGSFLLIFDLGHWYRFWKLFVRLRWTSPMSLGSWLLIAFSVVAFVISSPGSRKMNAGGYSPKSQGNFAFCKS